MKEFTTYLTFDGTTKEAMKFYAECFGAELSMITFGEANVPHADSEKNRIMHARISKGTMTLMASDSSVNMPTKLIQGNNFSISVNCESVEETEKFYKFLIKNGKEIMPLQETFWATRFGMLTDQFGINWMFNLEKKH